MASPVKPRMTTADPSIFSFFPEIFLFGVLPKRKIGKKRLTLGPPQVIELSASTPVYNRLVIIPPAARSGDRALRGGREDDTPLAMTSQKEKTEKSD